jgi:methionyl-tRNA synthetase
MKHSSKKRLVQTIALAYSNGDLHAGHLVEAIFADCHARHRRAQGDDVVFLGADDCHGTPIEIKAQSLGQAPEDMLVDVSARHRRDYASFDISFDTYHSTHSPENEALCWDFFDKMKAAGLIERRNVAQLFDETAGRFLSDRHVRGTCPKCATIDQYGDNCESCGATYQATELEDPISSLTGSVPIIAQSDHLFFLVHKLEGVIKEWATSGALQTGVLAKINEWFDEGLHDWDISRDAPYFGFPIPGEIDKFFYVWLDAPLGYIAALDAHLERTGSTRTWRDDWAVGSDTEIIHHIGKDIVSFHAVFWPALLTAGQCRLPDRIQAHGFLTVEGAKMSKSRGTFLQASDIAARIDSDAFRYAILARLGNSTTDIDFSAHDVSERVNSELVGKIANIPVRLRGLVDDPDTLRLSDNLMDTQLWDTCVALSEKVRMCFQTFETAKAIRHTVEIATHTNGFIQTHSPWRMTEAQDRHHVVSQALCQFHLIAGLLQPITPRFAQRCLNIFGVDTLDWDALAKPPLGQAVALPAHLMARLDREAIDFLSNTPANPNTQKEMSHEA